MTFEGMNIEAVRRIAIGLAGSGRSLSAVLAGVDRLVADAPWMGPDAQAFADDWRGQLRSRLQAAASALGEGSANLLAQAAEQDSASSGSGAGAVLAAAAGGAAGLLPAEGGGTEKTSGGYSVGAPSKPDITWDEDFVWNSQQPNAGDYVEWAKWGVLAVGAQLTMPDAAAAYLHYRENTGSPFTIDYGRAAKEDSAIQQNIDVEIQRSMKAAEEIVAGGSQDFQMTGPATATTSYPVTENWQKAIGGYQQWSSANVSVSGNTVTMTITVHAEDYYNFNRGQADIASGTSDNVNGRFQEVGFAKSFPTSGEVVRVVTWELGSSGAAKVSEPTTPTGR